DLDNRSLELVNIDVRLNADRIYQEIYNEYSSIDDINRHLQSTWVTEARESIHSQQEIVVEDLKEKVEQASENASYEVKNQDKYEATSELEVAKKILEAITIPIHTMNLAYRTWNLLPYHRYRGSDEPKKE